MLAGRVWRPLLACKPEQRRRPGTPAIDNGQQYPIFRIMALRWVGRSEEHTSELQSHSDLVCRLLLEKKNKAIPSGCTLDEDGQPTIDPDIAMKNRFMSPLGCWRQLIGDCDYVLRMLAYIVFRTLTGV